MLYNDLIGFGLFIGYFIVAGLRSGTDPSGHIEDPAAVPESPGLAEGAWKDTIVLPFNHPAAFKQRSSVVYAIGRHG